MLLLRPIFECFFVLAALLPIQLPANSSWKSSSCSPRCLDPCHSLGRPKQSSSFWLCVYVGKWTEKLKIAFSLSWPFFWMNYNFTKAIVILRSISNFKMPQFSLRDYIVHHFAFTECLILLAHSPNVYNRCDGHMFMPSVWKNAGFCCG